MTSVSFCQYQPECSPPFPLFLPLQVVPGFPFFASRVLLGKDGVSKVYGLGELDAFEAKALEALKPELLGSIKKGVEFANTPAAAPTA